jgi:site-specific DNA-adenine methylase
MIPYFGSKSNLVGKYPKPKHQKIIEPFAGSARYSLKYFDREVCLIDKYPVIIDIWHFLQNASEKDILNLPKIQKGQKVSDFNLSDIESKFMGFLVQASVGTPRNSVGSLNGINVERDLKRISKNLFKIKHWEIKVGDYKEIQNEECTWFIDPPYQFGGEHQYKFSNKKIDFFSLGEWCKNRLGHSIVCENTKADWLDFKPMAKNVGTNITNTVEAIWSNEKTSYDNIQASLF